MKSIQRHLHTALTMAFALTLTVTSAVRPAHAQADEPPQASYQVCTWGLLIREFSAPVTNRFVRIGSPLNYSPVAGSTFTVSGGAMGLFEGNVIVEVLDASGKPLFQKPTIAADPAGGAWSLDVTIPGLTAATPVTVRAYSTAADGTVNAEDRIKVNLNSTSGVPFVEITSQPNGTLDGFPILVEGNAGAGFDSKNRIVVRLLDKIGGKILAEMVTTVNTAEVGGHGTFKAELSVELAPGTPIVIYAFQPSATDSNNAIAEDTVIAIASPFARTYDRILILSANDPLLTTDDPCSSAEAEFSITAITPIQLTSVMALSTRSMPPQVTLIAQGSGPSVCNVPKRTRLIRTGDTFKVDHYLASSGNVICTMDLRSFSVRIPLGTLNAGPYTATVNGLSTTF